MNPAPPMDAPAGLLPLPRPLMTGEILDAGFRLFRAAILRCLPYSALMVLLLELPTLYSVLFTRDSLGLEVLRANYTALAYGVVFLLAVPVLGALLLRLDAVAHGRRPRFVPEVRLALMGWPRGVFATVAAFLIPVLLMVLGSAFTRGLSTEAVLVLAVPLFWPTALFVATLPAFWCGQLGPWSALGRSLRISRRRSWRLVSTIVVTFCLVAVFVLMVVISVGILSRFIGGADLWVSATVQALTNVVVGGLGVPFALAVLLVAHRDLEMRYAIRKRLA